MALGVDYVGQDCSLARSLEIVGERWTLLVLRNCFFGVRRFSDFQTHLGISRAVLTERLAGLVDHGLIERVPAGGREEYVLTEAGLALWPALFALTQWGEATTSPHGPRRVFAHTACSADLEPSGRCPACHEVPGPAELDSRPGPGRTAGPGNGVAGEALAGRRPLLVPVRDQRPVGNPGR